MQDKATLNPTPDQTFEIVGQGHSHWQAPDSLFSADNN